MKRILLVSLFCLGLLVVARAEFSFYLIDNFESGKPDKWYKFGEVKLLVDKNPSLEGTVRDVIAESCGDYSLQLKGRATNWFAGGIGTDIFADGTPFTRLQMDAYGNGHAGRIKIELFDDDNGNLVLEQDPARDWLATSDDKWVAEVPILGPGWTRISIPFSAFRLDNPGHGDGVWNPDHKDGSGGLLKIQLTLLTDKPQGEVEVALDNLLLTY
ncbi:MAG: hypothetical protein WC632_08220 [Candidatus Margulisiibacteriota bacterium]